MELYYSHEKREIRNEKGAIVPWKTAERLFRHGKVTDWNHAFIRLYRHNGDMDAVEVDYKEMENAHLHNG